jgi:hypothetical protein
VQIENKLNNFFTKIDKQSDKFGITKANAFGYIFTHIFHSIVSNHELSIIKGDGVVAIFCKIASPQCKCVKIKRKVNKSKSKIKFKCKCVDLKREANRIKC